jgi:hypothetical protein
MANIGKAKTVSHSFANNILKQGSITVEAAFVMPIVIFMVFALIYLSFYLHDYCTIQGSLDLALHKTAITSKNEVKYITGEILHSSAEGGGTTYIVTGGSEEDTSQIIFNLMQHLTKSLFLYKVSSVVENTDFSGVSISIKAKDEVVLPYFQALFDRFSTIRIIESAPVHNPAETIRRTEVILDTGSEIKGIDQLFSFLQQRQGN